MRTKRKCGDSYIPSEIAQSLARFRSELVSSSKTAFIMMRFHDTKAHTNIVTAIRDCLTGYGIRALRADDRQYHTDLYWNIMTYVYGSDFGVAVFERVEEESFNPNVAFEVGYMLALRKPVCLLKERTLQSLHADLIGKLYHTFDAFDLPNSVHNPLSKWLRDHDLVENKMDVVADLFASNERSDILCRRILVVLSSGSPMKRHQIRECLGMPEGESDSPLNSLLSRLHDLRLIRRLSTGEYAGHYAFFADAIPIVRRHVERQVKW